MVQRKGISISSYNFTVHPDEPDDAAKFGKLICQGLQKIGLPERTYITPPFCKSVKVNVYSEWHGCDVPMFSRINGGPSICMPAPKLIHIHWVQKKVIIIGFEWRLNQPEIDGNKTRKWHSLRGALTEKLPNLRYVSNPTGGDDWPFRWQYVYPIDPFKFKELLNRLQNDTEERHLMIDSTKQALKVAGEVFGW